MQSQSYTYLRIFEKHYNHETILVCGIQLKKLLLISENSFLSIVENVQW